MKYLTGIHALNIPCSLETCGDWHASALKWKYLKFLDTEDAFFGDYGIEGGKTIPNHEGTFNVANHIRACLDMLYLGDFANLQGMCDDYLVVNKYNTEIFEKILLLKTHPNWEEINRFVCKEYKRKWIDFKKAKAKKENNVDD